MYLLKNFPEIQVTAVDFRWASSLVLHPKMILPLLRRGFNPFVLTIFDKVSSTATTDQIPAKNVKIMNQKDILEVYSSTPFQNSIQFFQRTYLEQHYSNEEINEIIKVITQRK